MKNKWKIESIDFQDHVFRAYFVKPDGHVTIGFNGEDVFLYVSRNGIHTKERIQIQLPDEPIAEEEE